MTSLPDCETLVLALSDSTLFVTLNRPETKNALSDQMVSELTELCALLEGTRDIRAVVLRGSEGCFCAGGDISIFKESLSTPPPTDGSRDPLAIKNKRFGNFLVRLQAIPQVLIAVVEGVAFGGGLGLVSVTDVALCHADARFALSETGLGIPPSQIAPFIVQRIGLTATRHLALTGHRFDGVHAEKIGLVHTVASDREALEKALSQTLKEIGRCAPGANAETKRILLNTMTMPLDKVLDAAADTFVVQLRGDEGQEGVAAFLEKRPAAWTEQKP